MEKGVTRKKLFPQSPRGNTGRSTPKQNTQRQKSINMKERKSREGKKRREKNVGRIGKRERKRSSSPHSQQNLRKYTLKAHRKGSRESKQGDRDPLLSPCGRMSDFILYCTPVYHFI